MKTTASAQFFRIYILLPILLCTLVTGASGLMYEVTWHRYLANLCGSQAKATALILSIFLGGLSLGYFLFGILSRKFSPKQSLLLYAFVEGAIGLYAFIFPKLYTYALNHSSTGGAGFLQDALTCIFLIGFPTICMGSTIPLLTRAFSGDAENTARAHAMIYGSNTAGAFLGVVLAGVYFLPNFGLSYTLVMAACGNGIGALLTLVIFMLYSDYTEPEKKSQETDRTTVRNWQHWRYIAISFLCGYAALSLQTVLIRLAGVSFGSSEYSFSMVVASYVLLLAIGSFLVAGPLRSIRHLWMHISATITFCLLLYSTVPYWGWYGHHVRVLVSSAPQAQYLHFGLLFCSVSVLLFFPIGCLGAVLPLLFQRDSSGDSRSGEDAGYLYAANTLGCIAGSSIGGYYLLYWFNLDDVFKTALYALILALALSVPIAALSVRRRVSVLTVSSMLLLASCFLPSWDRRPMSIGTFRMQELEDISFYSPEAFLKVFQGGYEILFSEDGPNTSVAVTQSKQMEKVSKDTMMPTRSIMVNGKTDGATTGPDLATTKLLAYIPLLFSNEPPEEVAVIGFGTGITTGTIAWYDWVKHVDVIEISPLVKRVAHYFSPYNMNADSNEKISWYVDDAYRVLGRGTKLYNTIISEPSNPWVTGVERLYTKEFLTRAKKRLTPNGMYIQWVQLYSFSEDSLAIALKTFSEIFPHVRMFNRGGDLIIVGTNKPLDESNVRTAMQRSLLIWIQKDLETIGIDNFEALLNLEVALPIKYYSSGKLHTLEHPTLSYRAARDMFTGSTVKIREMIMEKPSFHPWYAMALRRSLLSYYIQSLSDSEEFIDSLRAYTMRNCDMERRVELVFPTCWKDLARDCQSGLLSLVALDALEVKNGVLPDEYILNLRKLFARFRGEPVETVESIDVAYYGLNVLNSVLTPYTQFSPEDINKLFSICYDSTDEPALICQKRMISLFVQLGYEDAAFEAYQRFIMLIPDTNYWEILQRRLGKSLATLERLPDDPAPAMVPPYFAISHTNGVSNGD